MGRFLVIGTGPLLEEQETRFVSGQSLRTLHFVRPLRAAGHDVKLATVPILGEDPATANAAYSSRSTIDRIRYKAFTTQDEARIVAMIRGVLDRNDYDGVVGINAYPAFLLARARPSVPFWADLNGWTLGEGVTRAAVVGHDRDLDHFWRLEAETLLAADRFSTVSQRQADALCGELAVVGRYGRRTFEWPFACSVPNAVYPVFGQLDRQPRSSPAPGIDAADFVVLWSGGFNTWTDVGMLAEGLAAAMEAVPTLHFVATGGAVHGHDDRTYGRFQELAAARLPRGRTHLLGWVETPLVAALHARANVGINIDSPNLETRFGARNRLTNMLGAGVPVLTTRGTEIAEWIEAQRAGEVIPPGNPAALAAALADAAANPARWDRRARRARQRAQEAFAPAATLGDFLSWCEAPARAPDRDPSLTSLNSPGDARRRGGAECEAAQWTRLKLDGQVGPLLHDRASLHRLRSRLPFRIWRALKKLGPR